MRSSSTTTAPSMMAADDTGKIWRARYSRELGIYCSTQLLVAREDVVPAVALGWAKAGFADLLVDLLDGHTRAYIGAGGANHILLHHRAAKVVGPTMQRLSRQVRTLRRPRRADVVEVVEHQAAERDHPQ